MNNIENQQTTPVLSDVTRRLALLAAPRLEPYKTTFKPTTDQEHLGAYLWGQAISASFHPFLGLAEVVIRNAIHRSLSLQCSKQSSESYPWYDRVADGSIVLRGKSLVKVNDYLYGGIPPLRKVTQPSPDLVVSRLSFGFWPNVMEELGNRHAYKTFSDVFGAHPNSKNKYWSFDANRSAVVLKLKRLQDLRNRICHFEAIWKHHWLGVSGTHWSGAVKGLRDLHHEMLELLGWCSPDAVNFYTDSFGWNWFNTLCTTNAVKGFMSNESQCARLSLILPTTQINA